MDQNDEENCVKKMDGMKFMMRRMMITRRRWMRRRRRMKRRRSRRMTYQSHQVHKG